MASLVFNGLPQDANKDVKEITVSGVKFKKGKGTECDDAAVLAKCEALGYFDIQFGTLAAAGDGGSGPGEVSE